MHGSVTICTSGDVGLGIMGRTNLCDRVAVDARTGLIGGKKIVGAGTVRHVAVAAIFENGCVVVDPGACLRLVTLRAFLGR